MWGFLLKGAFHMKHFGCTLFLIGLFVCVYLAVSSGFLAQVQHAKPFSTVSLPNINGLTLAQPPQSHANAHSVIGTPSLRPSFIDQVLARAHSPAQGTGQALYVLSQAYHIDDAYALAFFEHESSFGATGMARVTYSLGNIRCSQGYQCINGYRAYDNWIAGYTDWFHLIETLYIKQWHLTTVEAIVPVYAPTSDGNNVSGYIAAVEQAVDAWQRGEV
jgi:hypothetical protein